MFIVQTHAYIKNGAIYEAPANLITETLQLMQLDFIFIRHSIDGQFKSKVFFYENGQLVKETILNIPLNHISIIRYAMEVLYATCFISNIKYKKRIKEPIIAINLDPLNALSGNICKLIGSIKYSVFYTADYSDKRFNNGLLNAVFKFIDHIDIKFSDEVWNVSKRIFDLRTKQGVNNIKNFFIPNAPSALSADIQKQSHKNKNTLVTLGMVSDQMDFSGVFKAMNILKSKNINTVFKIIGTGELLERLKQEAIELGLEKSVKFLGHLSHDIALKEIGDSGIGLALYNGKWSFNFYGDSMKCREYFLFGLPVLTTDSHSTVEDIKDFDSGIIVNMNPDDYANAIIKILDNYDMYSQNSYKAGEKYSNIHKAQIKRLTEIL